MEELIQHILSHSMLSLRLLILSFDHFHAEYLLNTLVDVFLAHEKGSVLLDFCIVEELSLNGIHYNCFRVELIN